MRERALQGPLHVFDVGARLRQVLHETSVSSREELMVLLFDSFMRTSLFSSISLCAALRRQNEMGRILPTEFVLVHLTESMAALFGCLRRRFCVGTGEAMGLPDVSSVCSRACVHRKNPDLLGFSWFLGRIHLRTRYVTVPGFISFGLGVSILFTCGKKKKGSLTRTHRMYNSIIRYTDVLLRIRRTDVPPTSLYYYYLNPQLEIPPSHLICFLRQCSAIPQLSQLATY